MFDHLDDLTHGRESARLRERVKRLEEALGGVLDWYRDLPEPGLVPEALVVGRRLAEARAALAGEKEGGE